MKKGFTLIELLVVVLIIGILSAIALPQYNRAVKRSRIAEALVNIKHIEDVMKAQLMTDGTFSNCDGDQGYEFSGGEYVEENGETVFLGKTWKYALVMCDSRWGKAVQIESTFSDYPQFYIQMRTDGALTKQCQYFYTDAENKGICNSYKDNGFTVKGTGGPE